MSCRAAGPVGSHRRLAFLAAASEYASQRIGLRAGNALTSADPVEPLRGMSGRFATPIAVGRGYEGNSFQRPSETTSTVPSVTLMAVWSSMA